MNKSCKNCKEYKNKICEYWFKEKTWKDKCDRILGYPKYAGTKISIDQIHNCKDFIN